MKLELFWPVKPARINQGFGVNGDWYKSHGINIIGHNGLDLFALHGQPVRAAHDGVVTFSGEDGGGGCGVVIRTNEPREYQIGEAYFKSIYWHLIKEIQVKTGQQVKVGDIIGLADSTGFSTGDHLHFGLKAQQKGEQDWEWVNLDQANGYLGAIDPTPYLNYFFAEDAQGIFAKISLIQEAIEKIKKIIEWLKGRQNQ